MKRLHITILFALLCFTYALAQPPQVKKAAKSMFKLTTFTQDGTILHTGYGAFVGNDGMCLSNWEPFIGASSANIIDGQGRKYDVDCLIGANEIYNVAKFRVIVPADKKMEIEPLAVASASLADGQKCWFVEYAVKNPAIKQFAPSKIETFNGNMPYYIFDQTAAEELAGSPFINDAGELIGLMQPAKKRTDLYCASAQYAMTFTVTGMTANEPTMRQTLIRTALPEDYQQALLSLMVANSRFNTPSYLATANEFIARFPNQYDGYSAKADYLTAQGKYKEADATMQEGIEKSEKKDEAHFAFSKLIYNKVSFANDSTFTAWTYDKAIAEADAAYTINPLPIYIMQKSKVQFADNKFQDAYDGFMHVSTTNIRSGECFYYAALCQQKLNAEEGKVTALLDSAVACYEQPYKRDAAPYILIRGKWYNQTGQYRKAVTDYMLYEEVMKNQLTAQFYYEREQVELSGKMYQLALNDIDKALQLAPRDYILLAEKALLLVRVNHHEEAIATADLCLSMYPEYGDAYAIRGLAQILSKKKAEGMADLEKAKSLGSEMADGFIEKYGK